MYSRLEFVSPFQFLPMQCLWQNRRIEANACSINTIWVMFHLKFFFFFKTKVFSYAWSGWCITIMKKSKTTRRSQPPLKTIMLLWVIHSSSHTVQMRWRQVGSEDWVRSRTHTGKPQIKHNIILFVSPSLHYPFNPVQTDKPNTTGAVEALTPTRIIGNVRTH